MIVMATTRAGHRVAVESEPLPIISPTQVAYVFTRQGSAVPVQEAHSTFTDAYYQHKCAQQAPAGPAVLAEVIEGFRVAAPHIEEPKKQDWRTA